MRNNRISQTFRPVAEPFDPTSWRSPVIRLAVLTIIALLLGIATSRASTPEMDGFCVNETEGLEEGPKKRYTSALCGLYHGDYDTFWSLLPSDGKVRVTVIDRPFSPYPGAYAINDYDRAVTESQWEREIRPVLQSLIFSGSYWDSATEPLRCDDFGLCQQATWEGHFRIRFAEREGELQLVEIQADYNDAAFDEGCMR